MAGRSANALSTSAAASFSSIAPTTAIINWSRAIPRLAAATRSARSIRAERLERAVGRLAVGVIGKGLRLPVAVGEGAGIVGDVAQAGVHVLAHPLERLLVESRRVDGEAQELGGAVEVLGQRAHAPAPMVAVAVEAHLDRLLVERPVKGLRIEVARALVEEPRHQGAEAGLVGRVLRRAAAHGEFERDQRHRVGVGPARA